jgi:membrane-associated protease RseP (regulator of RpoE activity)
MRKFPFLNILLFLVTLLSTMFVGAGLSGVGPEVLLEKPVNIIKGFPFSFSLMLILLSHEFSHYFASKRHGVKATLPYFIPFPNIIGTLGAFIKMKSPIITRRALIDIGASGPIVGFIVSVVIAVIGLRLSEVAQIPKTPGVLLNFGDSILFYYLSSLVMGVIPPGQDIILHPIAFAGWIGLFVTSINLMPVGQLDGGHITYALGGEKFHKKTSMAVFIILLSLGLTKFFIYGDFLPGTIDLRGYADQYLWEWWALWAVILSFFGLRHPPVLHWETPLDPRRKFVGGVTFFIFIITFIPVPIRAL